MTPVVAVITAKAHSSRLPHKNILLLGGKPLTAWSIEAAVTASLRTLVATDSAVIADCAKHAGCEVFGHPSGKTHADVIKETLSLAHAESASCVLLQPSSPFRSGRIIERCIRRHLDTGVSVFTSNVVHDVPITNGGVIQTDSHVTLWDGCVAVFPPGGVCRFSPAVSVRNLPANCLQIDTEEDYEVACVAAESFAQFRTAVPPQIAYVLDEFLRARDSVGERVAVVGRPGAVPDGCYVWHVNHCLGYDGGRCDGVALVANKHLRQAGISDRTVECVRKAKAVLVRDNGELSWLRQSLPEMAGKFMRMGAFTPIDDRITTGTLLVDLLTTIGCAVTLVGAFRPASAQESLGSFHWPAVSREIAVLHTAGAFPA